MKTAWINLTDFCNNNCLWCYGKGNFSQSKLLPYDMAVEIMSWIAASGCTSCILIGGEPTLHPQFIEIVNYGNSIGLNMAIVSNGRKFTNVRFCKNIIEAGVKPSQIVLSMSSYSDESAVKFTGTKHSFVQFSNGFRNLINLGLNPGVNIVISKPLVDKLEYMLTWIKENNGTHVAVNLCVPTVTPNGTDTSFCLSPDILAKEAVQVYKIGNNLGLKLSFLFNIPYCLLPQEDLDQMLDADVIRSGCSVRNHSAILFNVDGNLISCNHLSSQIIHTYAEIKDNATRNNIKRFFTSDQSILDVQKASCVFRTNYCKSCNYWDMCSGGCPIYWAGYDPTHYIYGINSQRKEEIEI